MLLSPIESEIIFRKAMEDGTEFFLNHVPVKCRFAQEILGNTQVATLTFHHSGYEFSFSAKIMEKDGVFLVTPTSPMEKREKTGERAFITIYFRGGQFFCYKEEGHMEKNSAVIEGLDGKSLKIKTVATLDHMKPGEKITLELNRRPLPVRFTGMVTSSEKNTAEITFSDIPAEVARPLKENPIVKSTCE